MRIFILALLTSIISTAAFAGEYKIPYRKDNRWIHKDDRKFLDALIAMAKKENATEFKVILPSDRPKIQIERLIVLRDTLAKSLQKSIIIEQTNGTTQQNTLILSY